MKADDESPSTARRLQTSAKSNAPRDKYGALVAEWQTSSLKCQTKTTHQRKSREQILTTYQKKDYTIDTRYTPDTDYEPDTDHRPNTGHESQS